MSGSAAAVLDFAAAQILREGTAPGGLPAGLSAVLERMVGAFGAAFGVRAALAFQTSAGQPPAVLAAYPREAVDAALLARIGALSVAQRDAASDAPVELLLGGPAAASALVAYSAPVGGRCLCALALIGDLLMLDRLEAGALPLDLAAVSVSGLVTEAVRIASPGAARQGVTLEVSIGRGPAVPASARSRGLPLPAAATVARDREGPGQAYRPVRSFRARDTLPGMADRRVRT